VRHGLTAETVIGALEDAEDYTAFEAAIIADYDAQSAVERELVLQLASLLWRLRRATVIETGLFEIQAQHLRDYREHCRTGPGSRDVIQATLGQGAPTTGFSHDPNAHMKADDPMVEFARCFLRLTNLPSFSVDRLSRYEATLWSRVTRTLYALEILDRRKPQERSPRVNPARLAGTSEARGW
jgi:hypothetical protein